MFVFFPFAVDNMYNKTYGGIIYLFICESLTAVIIIIVWALTALLTSYVNFALKKTSMLSLEIAMTEVCSYTFKNNNLTSTWSQIKISVLLRHKSLFVCGFVLWIYLWYFATVHQQTRFSWTVFDISFCYLFFSTTVSATHSLSSLIIIIIIIIIKY